MKTERLFILKVVKYGEADLLVFGLNSMGAKVPLFAKAALKSKKRFGGGVLESTHYIEATYNNTSRSFRGKSLSKQNLSMQNHTFYFLKEASLQNDFHKIRKDYNRLQLGLYMIHLVYHFCHEGLCDNAQVFHLLGNSLRSLETSQNLSNLQVIFELRLLKIQGFLKESSCMRIPLAHSILEHEQFNLDPTVISYIKKSTQNMLLPHFQHITIK